MKIAKIHTVAIALLVTLTAGCASAPERTDRGHKAARIATYGAHAGWVYARAVYENPVNRPVSHTASLASLALKSTGGLLRRVVIGTVQMPALNGEIPEVSYAAPMDLAAFEEKLDRITGTRRDTGRIKFLVDGDEYFCRLMETIANAEVSVDMRTYIFDNDDYAVAVADTLKERSEESTSWA